MIQWCCGQRNHEGSRVEEETWNIGSRLQNQEALWLSWLLWLVAAAQSSQGIHIFIFITAASSHAGRLCERKLQGRSWGRWRKTSEKIHGRGRKTHFYSPQEHHPQTFISLKHNLYSTVQTSWVTPSSLHILLPRIQNKMNQCHSCTQDTTWQGTNFKLYLCYQQPVSGKHLFPFL